MTRPTRLLILFALFACALLAAASAAPAATLHPVTFGDTWKTQAVSTGTGAGFEASAFDDSSWATNTAPFGQQIGCFVPPAPTGTAGWTVGNDLLLRKTFNVPAGTGSGSVTVLVDNDVTVYLNGTQIGNASHENCANNSPPGPFTFSASALHAGDNVIAIRAVDRGGERYIDAKLDVELTDTDGDGIADSVDNCPSTANADQADIDEDGTGDACDATDDRPDTDGDGVKDFQDNCDTVANANQADADNDGRGDVCDGYDVTITPSSSIPAGKRTTLTVTITNHGGSYRWLTDATVTAPSAVKPYSATQGSISGQTLTLSGLSLADGQSTTVDLTVDAACTAGSGSWSSTATANDGEGPSDGLTLLTAAPSSTVTGACSLAFTTQPQDARTNQNIRGGADFDPAGVPFVVSVKAANGDPAPGATPTIALSVGPTSTGFGVLHGTFSVAAVGGAASFSTVTLDKAGTYRLVAASSGLTSGTSASFTIADTAVPCPPSGCSGSVTTPSTQYTVAATSTGSSTGSQFLKIGVNDGPPLDCALYTERNPDTLTVDLNSATLEKNVTIKLSKAVVQSYGKTRIDICFSAPYLFLPRPFTLLTFIKYDSDANGTAETWWVGRLPNCLNYDADDRDPDGWEPKWTRLFPCVTKRRKQSDGGMLIGVRMPARAEDPRMR
jgi:hypothetical protein